MRPSPFPCALVLAVSAGCATEAFDLTDGAVDAVPAPCTGPADCGDPTPHCDEGEGACVACLAHPHCPEAGASHCDPETRACIPCVTHADCGHVPEAHACHDGTCVPCTPDTEADACGGTSCDPATHTCTDVPVASVGLCRPCIADSECASEVGPARCVPIHFQGTDMGTVCLVDAASTDACPRRFISTRTATSTSGVEGATYCYPTESLTTCQAILAFRSTCPDEGTCGHDALDDGLCRDDGAGARCTYECLGDDDCPHGVRCHPDATPRHCCTNTPQEGPCAP